MIMKSRLFALPLLAMILLGAIVSSCSKDHKLLDVIPASVGQAGTIRVKQFFEEAGCKFDNGSVTVPAQLQGSARFTGLVDFVAAVDASGSADPNAVAWAADSRSNLYMTMLVNDRAKFKEASAEKIEWADETGSFSCGKVGNMTVLLDDARVWLTDREPADAVKGVETFVKEAKDGSLASMTGLEQVLSAGNLVNAVVRQEGDAKGKKGDKGENPQLEATWATLTLNVSDNKLVGNSSVIRADGTPEPIKGLKAVNPAVLAYVPENFNFALGIGVTPEFDWSVLTGAISAAGGFQVNAMLQTVIPYLQSIDGTIFLAAGPANQSAYDELDFGNWQFMAMVHLPQQKINDVIGMIRSSLFMAGVSPRQGADGMMIVPQYGMDLYIGNVDGYLAVGNIPFEPTRQNSLAPVFAGKDGAMTLNIPSMKVFGGSMPDFGMDLQIRMSADNTTGEVSLVGSDTPILQAILSGMI